MLAVLFFLEGEGVLGQVSQAEILQTFMVVDNRVDSGIDATKSPFTDTSPLNLTPASH